MLSKRSTAPTVLTTLFVASWISIALTDPGRLRLPWEIVVMCLFGTLYGQATLAAAWAALGPLPLLWRLPLSLAWIAALGIAFATHMVLHMATNIYPITLLIAACLGGVWLLMQIPLWFLAAVYSLRVRHCTDPPASAHDRQFGIGQVMLLTLIVAVVLGILRWIVGEAADRLAVSGPNDWKGLGLYVFLVIAGAVMQLLLLLAALLPRYWAWATSGVLILMVAGTCLEQFVLGAQRRRRSRLATGSLERSPSRVGLGGGRNDSFVRLRN